MCVQGSAPRSAGQAEEIPAGEPGESAGEGGTGLGSMLPSPLTGYQGIKSSTCKTEIDPDPFFTNSMLSREIQFLVKRTLQGYG
jgi:hypothetical protein